MIVVIYMITLISVQLIIRIKKIIVQTTCDIVKAHGGELKVEIHESEYTEFKIELP